MRGYGVIVGLFKVVNTVFQLGKFHLLIKASTGGDIILTHEASLNSKDEKVHIYFIILPTSFQIKYKKDLSKMKGAAHFHSLTAEDNLVLKQAQSVNKLVSEVRA